MPEDNWMNYGEAVRRIEDLEESNRRLTLCGLVIGVCTLLTFLILLYHVLT